MKPESGVMLRQEDNSRKWKRGAEKGKYHVPA
jgi:hypothetical protein